VQVELSVHMVNHVNIKGSSTEIQIQDIWNIIGSGMTAPKTGVIAQQYSSTTLVL
jgi:hypothetical protein